MHLTVYSTYSFTRSSAIKAWTLESSHWWKQIDALYTCVMYVSLRQMDIQRTISHSDDHGLLDCYRDRLLISMIRDRVSCNGWICCLLRSSLFLQHLQWSLPTPYTHCLWLTVLPALDPDCPKSTCGIHPCPLDRTEAQFVQAPVPPTKTVYLILSWRLLETLNSCKQ